MQTGHQPLLLLTEMIKMNVQTVAVGLVGLVLAVIMIGLVAVPVIEDSVTGTPYNGTNSTEDTWTYMDSSPSFTWNRSTAGTVTLTIDGVSKEVAKDNNNVMVLTDDFAIRTIAGGAQLWDYGDSAYTLSSDGTIAITLSVTNGTYSLNFGGTTTTGTVSWALLKDPNGKWGLFTGGVKATIGQTVLVGHMYGSTMGAAYGLMEYANGEQGTQLVGPYNFSGSSIVEVSDVTYDVGYTKTGTGQVIGFYDDPSLTISGTEYDQYIYAPIDFESTGESSGDVNSTLLMMIPTLLIIVAVMMAVRMFTGRD